VVKKIQEFEFGVKYLSFGAIYLNFVTIYLNFGAIYLNFGAKIENTVFSKGVGGGGPPGPPGGLGIGVGKKYSAHPLPFLDLCLCAHLGSSQPSIVGVPSKQALPGFLLNTASKSSLKQSY